MWIREDIFNIFWVSESVCQKGIWAFYNYKTINPLLVLHSLNSGLLWLVIEPVPTGCVLGFWSHVVHSIAFRTRSSQESWQEHLASELYWVPVSGNAGYWEAWRFPFQWCASSEAALGDKPTSSVWWTGGGWRYLLRQEAAATWPLSSVLSLFSCRWVERCGLDMQIMQRPGTSARVAVLLSTLVLRSLQARVWLLRFSSQPWSK